MKIGIITHYDVHNHGAILQMNALIKVLRQKFNADAHALQFDENYDFLGRELKAKYDVLRNECRNESYFRMVLGYVMDKGFSSVSDITGEEIKETAVRGYYNTIAFAK